MFFKLACGEICLLPNRNPSRKSKKAYELKINDYAIVFFKKKSGVWAVNMKIGGECLL